MLCKAITEENFNDMNLSNHYSNLKFDGERILIIKKADRIKILNRNGIEKSEIYIEIKEAIDKLDFDFVIDGEMVTKDNLFNSLQHRSNCKPTKERLRNYPIKFMVFDVLEIRGQNLINLTLTDRKNYLRDFEGLDNIEVVRFYENEDIRKLWEKVKVDEKEGIILKLKNSKYQFKRSNDWIKCKNFKEKVIEFNLYEMNNAGIKLSNGFNEVQVQGLERAEKIKERIDDGEKVKINVQYLEITKKGKLRFPSCKEVIIPKI